MRTRLIPLTACALAVAFRLAAQTDEIQVYDGSLAKVGEFTLTLHTNYVVNGIDTPAFPGAVVANHSLNGVPEFAYGVTDWFEQDDRYMRVGFGWPLAPELDEGLKNISASIAAAKA